MRRVPKKAEAHFKMKSTPISNIRYDIDKQASNADDGSSNGSDVDETEYVQPIYVQPEPPVSTPKKRKRVRFSVDEESAQPGILTLISSQQFLKAFAMIMAVITASFLLPFKSMVTDRIPALASVPYVGVLIPSAVASFVSTLLRPPPM